MKQRVMTAESRLQKSSVTPGFGEVPQKYSQAFLQLEPISISKMQPLIIFDNPADGQSLSPKQEKP